MTSPSQSPSPDGPDAGDGALGGILGGGLVNSLGGDGHELSDGAAGAIGGVLGASTVQKGADSISSITNSISDAGDALTSLNRVLSRWVHWWTTPGNALRGLGGIVGGILIILALGMLVGVTKDLGEGDS